MSTVVRRIAVGLSIATTWLFVLAMTVPRAQSPGNGDYGFFTAVADRIRAGDTLYEQVWDNKDPFIFHSLALARTLGIPGAWALELMWVVIAALAAFSISRQVSIGPRLASFIAFALAPWIILGYPYFMGTSHLPGIALTLAALSLAGARRPLLAGIALGLIIFFKLILVPLAIVVLIVAVLTSRKSRALWLTAAGAAGTAAVATGVLLVRGEFVGFVSTQVHNVFYSQSPIVSAAYTGVLQKVAQHVVILVNPHVAVVGLASLAILIAAGWRLRSRAAWGDGDGVSMLWATGTAALVMGAVTVMAAGKWLHHAEVFATSSILLLILLALVTTSVWKWTGTVAAVLAAAATFALAGAPSPINYVENLRHLPQAWADANETDPLTNILEGLEPVPVMFIGQGNLVPRSDALADWPLACRHIAQRQFDPQRTYTETIECLDEAGLVVVANDFGPDPLFPAYTDFGSRVESSLSASFGCKEIEGFRLCAPK